MLRSSLAILTYLWQFSPSAAKVCKPLRKLTSTKLSGHGTTHTIRCHIRSRSSAGKGQNVVPKGWGTCQQSTVENNICKPNSDRCQTHYSNTEREALDILHDPEKVHHYCLTSEVSVITDHKIPVGIFKKDVANLSHRLQSILLYIH